MNSINRDIIRQLPDSVANQIAAGEVIQRPASVIKELVENAVDAGAKEINIIIKDAGRTLIQVIDDGCGMSETDARMAFERHATSKISVAADLSTLVTMGFRGEALPSICAIAQVELRTRRADDQMGTRLVINGSKVEAQEACMCTAGSNFMVRNIFYNVPGRRKFLRSDTVELSNIMREFERLALVNNSVKMTIDTGTRTIDLRPGTFRQRIADLWKNNLSQQLLPIEIDTSIVKIKGYISRPEGARKRNALQYLIVNGRNMRHPGFHKAILNSYDKLIPSDTQPCYFIKLEVDPASIDVNVHPTKNEIKFEYEQEIWRILSASVKAALGKFSAVPSIDFNTDILQVTPPRNGEFIDAPTVNIDPHYNPFAGSAPRAGGGSYRTTVPKDWDKLYAGFENRHQQHPDSIPEQAAIPVPDDIPELHPEQIGLLDDESAELSDICLQYGLKYIIMPTQGGLMVIDQHRAHVKVLYEEYMANVNSNELTSQSVMFPETVTLTTNQIMALESIEDELKRIGYKIVYVEDNIWRIDAVPSLLGTRDGATVLLSILDSVCDDPDKNETSTHDLVADVALVIARSSAIRGGTRLTQSAMEHLVSKLLSLPDPSFTPQGNPVFKIISDHDIKALFK